jgi:hypothetical protein
MNVLQQTLLGLKFYMESFAPAWDVILWRAGVLLRVLPGFCVDVETSHLLGK